MTALSRSTSAWSLLDELGSPLERKNLFPSLIAFCSDPSPEVRTDALRSLTTLHRRGYGIPLEVQPVAAVSLRDAHASVRSEAMHVLWLLCHEYPQAPVASGQPLIDDAFNRIAAMSTDSDVGIRVQACRLLGSLHAVRFAHLSQTLTKQPLAAAAAAVAAGVDEPGADVRLLDDCAGAFVHGLEDEFAEVRSATVDSMCELALRSPEFAAQSVEFIVDMVNDEVDEVRVLALSSLRRLGAAAQLNEELLGVVLSVLEDTNPEARQGVHHLLGSARLSSPQGVLAAARAVLAGLQRRPTDAATALPALRDLGRHHAPMCLVIFHALLRLDPRYMSAQRTLDELDYVGSLMCVANAAAHNDALFAALPAHVHEHIEDLHRMHPDLCPSFAASPATDRADAPARTKRRHTLTGAVPAEDDVAGPAVFPDMATDRPPGYGAAAAKTMDWTAGASRPTARPDPGGPSDLLTPIESTLMAACSLLRAASDGRPAEAEAEADERERGRVVEATRLLALCERHAREFARIAEYDRVLGGCSEWRRLLSRWLRRFVSSRGSAVPPEALVSLTWEMETLFAGLTPALRLFVRLLRLCSLARVCLAQPSPLHSTHGAKFSEQWAETERLIALYGLERPAFLAVGPDPTQRLHAAQSWRPFAIPTVPHALKRRRATLHAPLPTGAVPLECAAQMPFRLSLEASLHYVSADGSLYILATLPDRTRVVELVPRHAVTPLHTYASRMRHYVELTLPAWSDAGTVRVQLALAAPSLPSLLVPLCAPVELLVRPVSWLRR